jgi:hypothetical protein
MKNKVLLPIIFFAIIAVAISYLVISGKDRIEEAQQTEIILQQNTSLTDSVVCLESKASAVEKKLKAADSIVSVQTAKIADQIQKISKLDQEAKTLKSAPKLVMASKPEIIYIHDTVFITEKKNFWGKTRKTVTSVQSIDSVFREEPIDSL